MIIERRLRPHPRLAQVLPNVLHTARVITYLEPEPEPAIVDAVLRVGSGKAAADNMHAGGIVVPIDLASGECGQATRSEEHTSELQSLMRITYAVFCLTKKLLAED